MNDDEVLMLAIAVVNEKINKLNVSGKNNSYYTRQLTVIRDDLEKLFSLTSPTNNLVHLFCRRLARLMDYNESILIGNWLNLHKELLYVLEHHDISIDKLHHLEFSSILKLEGQMEEREIQFKKNFVNIKTLHELLADKKYRDCLHEYLEKCYSFHSKLEVRGLVENVDDFLLKTCQSTDIQLNSQTREHLQTKLKCIKIPFTCSYNLLRGCKPTSYLDFQSRKTLGGDENVFLPGMDEIRIASDTGIMGIHERLAESRWLVILGDPGSAKTTLMRYIMQIFSLAAIQDDERVLIGGVDYGPLRIPILIRIGEFSESLDYRPTMTLFDYIGKHTWFSQFYGSDDIEYLLKELIRHGHALIILDGLDEISAFERREQIITLIRDFIHDYVHGRDFLSAFDDVPKDFNQQSRSAVASEKVPHGCSWRLEETQPPSMPGGNQIIITSRIVGYNLHRLDSQLIGHYVTSPMSNKHATLFIEQWFDRVDQEVRNILLHEDIHLDDERMNTLKIQQQNTLKKILSNTSKQLSLHPLMLSIICSCVFKILDDNLLPKSVAQLYHKTIQFAVDGDTSQQQSRIPKNVLIQFETELALYLHSHSSSGLIDEFDINRLCSLVLKQQRISRNNAELRQYTDELLALISSNNSIIVERGLRVFNFVHLSFQEYFVGLSLLNQLSIDDTIRRILTYAVKPRSHEPIRFALSWMSHMWPHDNYVKFCRKLVTQSIHSAIPLGALVLLDVLHDIERLPSNRTIYAALDSLIDHPSMVISVGCLGQKWPVLPLDDKLKWMQLSLTNEKRIFKFCKSFLYSIFLIEHQSLWRKHSDMLPAICQKLWSFCSTISSVEFIITQTLQRITTSLDIQYPIFQDGLPQYLISHGISQSKIHPLVLSVIIALYGGTYIKKNKINFSPKYMYRDSSAYIPIIEYIQNINDSHLIKMQKLIEQYEHMLQNFSPEDISNDITDIFIALICLCGLSQPSIYHKFSAHKALPLALNRFKLILLFLKKSDKLFWTKTTKLFFSEIELIINVFALQSDQNHERCKRFTLACLTACDRLRIEWLSHLSSFKDLYRYQINCCPKSFDPLMKYFSNKILYEQHTHVRGEPIPEAIQNVDLFKLSHEQLNVLLSFVPNSLVHLYHRLVIMPDDQGDLSLLIVLLSQCLIYFNDYIGSEEMFVTLCDLLPLFKKYNLENYVLGLFWEGKSRYKCNPIRGSYDFFDKFSTNCTKNCKELIVEEQQRIIEAKQLNSGRQKDVQLFAASLSLARLFQVQYRNGKNEDDIEHIDTDLLVNESEPVLSAIENINDRVLYIIAVNTILNMEHPFIFSEHVNIMLRSKIVSQLLELLPNLPLLTATLLFVRCQSICQAYSSIFEQLTTVIGNKLDSVSMDEETIENHKAVYVALNSIDNISLAPLLIEFEKRIMNIGDLLQMNSVIFHRYFTDMASFGASNHILLSSMYLSELAVDAQILRKNMTLNKENTISLSEKLKQLLIKSNNVITFEIATLITSSIETCKEEDVIINGNKLFECHVVEKDAQPVLLQLFNFLMNASIKSLLYYVALLLAKNDFITPTLIQFIEDLCCTNIDRKFENIIRKCFDLQSIDSVLIRQVLKTLIRGVHHSSLHTGAIVRSCEIMEFILQLEYKQLSSDDNCLLNKSFLMIVDGCSEEVQIYLSEHLRTITNSEVQNTIKERYLVRMVTWIMQHFTFKNCSISDVLYNCIISFFHNQQFPRVQEAVINGLQYIFMQLRENNIFSNDNVRILLENTINLYVQTVNTNSENLLTACLYAYGYCLRFCNYYRNQKPSSEMYSLLTGLLETSSSSLVTTRAGQCLLIIELYVHKGSISNWLGKINSNPEQIYNVFIRCTFDEFRLLGDLKRDNALVHVLLNNPTDLIPKFFDEMYMYLSEATTNCSIFKQVFPYIQTNVNLCRENLSLCQAAIQKRFSSEQKFKSMLYQVSKQGNDLFLMECTQLYTSFGDITPDLINMVLCIDYKYSQHVLKKIETLIAGKRVLLDRDTIESVYMALESPSKQTCATRLLLCLASAGFVSILEVFQQISDSINKRSSGNVYSYQEDYEDLFATLLKLSCIASEQTSFEYSYELFDSEDKIGINTEEQICDWFDRSNRSL